MLRLNKDTSFEQQLIRLSKNAQLISKFVVATGLKTFQHVCKHYHTISLNSMFTFHNLHSLLARFWKFYKNPPAYNSNPIFSFAFSNEQCRRQSNSKSAQKSSRSIGWRTNLGRASPWRRSSESCARRLIRTAQICVIWIAQAGKKCFTKFESSF